MSSKQQPIVITRKGKAIESVQLHTPETEVPKSKLRVDVDAILKRLDRLEHEIAQLKADAKKPRG